MRSAWVRDLPTVLFKSDVLDVATLVNSADMSLGIDKALRSWRSGNETCSALLLHAESERAICAGASLPATSVPSQILLETVPVLRH